MDEELPPPQPTQDAIAKTTIGAARTGKRLRLSKQKSQDTKSRPVQATCHQDGKPECDMFAAVIGAVVCTVSFTVCGPALLICTANKARRKTLEQSWPESPVREACFIREPRRRDTRARRNGVVEYRPMEASLSAVRRRRHCQQHTLSRLVFEKNARMCAVTRSGVIKDWRSRFLASAELGRLGYRLFTGSR